METAGGEMASAMAVTSTSGTMKKIFRARKTMTASCRQQIATLNKIKKSSKIGTVVKESLVLPNDVQQQQTNLILIKNCMSQLSTSSEMEIHWSQSPSRNGFKTSVESPVLPKEHVQQTEFVLVKNCITLNNTSSEMEIHQSQSPYPDGFKTSAESPVLPKEDIQQQQTELILVNCITQNNLSEMEIHQSQSPISRFKTSAEVSHDSALKTDSLEGMWEDKSKTCENSAFGVACSTTTKNQFGDASLVSSTEVVEKGKPISDCASLQDIGKDSLKTNIDNGYPVTETINESLTLQTINEDFFLEMNSAVGLVTPLGDLDTDSTKAAVPSNESSDSCGTTGTSSSVLLNVPVNLHVDAAYNFSKDGNPTSVDCDKKRSFSGDAGIPEAKRAKTSNKSLLVEIDHFIQRRIQTVFKESFDQRIQDLSQQINLIQCKEDNTDLLTRHLGSIRGLGRRIKYAVRVQNEVGKQSSKLPSVGSTCKELSKPEAAVISSTNPPVGETSASLTETNYMQNLSADCSTPVVVSDNETEQQSDQGQIEHPKNLSTKVNHSAIRKIMESIKEHRNRTLSSRMDKQPMAVIDLTDDEEQKADSDLKLDAAHLSPSHAMPSSPAPVQEDIKDENLPRKCSEKKEKLSENKKEYSYDVTEKTFSGHKSVNTHDSVAYLERSPNPDLQILKPPQKPELRLAQVQNPKGIALSWNITQTDPNCAPAQVYCLYVHQENPKNSKKLWKKVGEIKALPLPMACTLTQFVDDATYSFVLRAKDASGRFGPLCDIQSTTLKSLNTPKKT